MIGVGIGVGLGTPSELSRIITMLRSVGGSLYLPGPTNRVSADGSGVSAVDGGVVGYVPDLVGSGNALTQATTANKPLVKRVPILGYAERYALGFDGVSDSISGTDRVAPTLTGGYTIICACAASLLGARKIAGDNARSLEITPSGSVSATHRGAASISGGLVAAGEPFIAAARYTGGELLLQKNGVTLAQSLVGAPTTAATVFTVGNRGNSTDWWLGDFYGAIRVPSAISDAQLAKLTVYLAKVAGVAL